MTDTDFSGGEGYGVSTEHTAYQNLVEGVPPERSGSAELNGEVLANQIGGQIFSDCWGLACPGESGKSRCAGRTDGHL